MLGVKDKPPEIIDAEFEVVTRRELQPVEAERFFQRGGLIRLAIVAVVIAAAVVIKSWLRTYSNV